MAEFKVGDKVKVVCADQCRAVGEVGTVIEVDDSPVPFKVLYTTEDRDGDLYDWHGAYELELQVKEGFQHLLKPGIRAKAANGRVGVVMPRGLQQLDAGDDLIVCYGGSWDALNSTNVHWKVVKLYDIPEYNSDLLNPDKKGPEIWSLIDEELISLEAAAEAANKALNDYKQSKGI